MSLFHFPLSRRFAVISPGQQYTYRQLTMPEKRVCMLVQFDHQFAKALRFAAAAEAERNSEWCRQIPEGIPEGVTTPRSHLLSQSYLLLPPALVRPSGGADEERRTRVRVTKRRRRVRLRIGNASENLPKASRADHHRHSHRRHGSMQRRVIRNRETLARDYTWLYEKINLPTACFVIRAREKGPIASRAAAHRGELHRTRAATVEGWLYASVENPRSETANIASAARFGYDRES